MTHPDRPWPVRLYRRALAVYPAPFRERFGAEMEQVFCQEWQEACRRGASWERELLLLRTITDLLVTSAQQRLLTWTPFRFMKRSFLSNRRFGSSVVGGLLVAACVLGLTAAVSFALPKTYMSSARVKLDDLRPGAVSQAVPFDVQTELEVVRSKLVLYPAIERADLAKTWSQTYLSQGTLNQAEVFQILCDKLEVRQFRNTHILEIRVYDRDRDGAAAIANVVAQSYVAYRSESAANHGLRPMIIDLAEPALRSVRPNIPLNLFLGLLAAGGLGLISGLTMWVLLGRPSRTLPAPTAASA